MHNGGNRDVIRIQHDQTHWSGKLNRMTTQRQAPGKLQSFEDHYPDFVSRLDRELNYVYVNPALVRALGLGIDELIGKKATERWLPSAVPDIYEEKALAALAGGNEQRFQFCITTAEEGTRHFETRLIPEWNENGEVESLLSVTYDITAHKVTENSIRDSDERLRMALRAAEVGPWQWDVKNDRITLEGHALQLMALDDKFDGTSAAFLSAIHPDDRAAVDLAVRRSIETGAEFKVEFRRSGGEDVCWVMAKGQLYSDTSGAPDNLIGVVYDITPRKLIETARQQMLEREQAARAEAEAATRARDEFLAIISHELRTPLSAMLGWVQVLYTRKPGDGVYERAIETIERNAKRQNQLIEDLLDTSRIISGKLRIEVQPLYVAPLVEEALEGVRPAANARGISLNTFIDSPAFVVMGDHNRLQQVLWNVLSNAIKFTPSGGRVDVHLTRVDSDIQIIVSDTGKGITPKFLSYVFDPFRQEDSSSARRQGGLGLGLALARRLVEMHGGTIEARSDGEGLGSVFTISIPSQTAGRTTMRMNLGEMQKALDAASEPDLSRSKILIVDDDADVRDLLAIRLQHFGAVVETADSVKNALTIIHSTETRPDLIVSDIAMPGEDGFSLLRKVRALEPEDGGTIPAIALTAYSRVKDRIDALAAGFQMHLSKPVDADDLALGVSSILERYGRQLK